MRDYAPMPGNEPKTVLVVHESFTAEVAREYAPDDTTAQVLRVMDPAQALETVHWGRNYLYAVTWSGPNGPVEVIVKQFRNQGLRRRLERRLRGSKAARAWSAARALETAGVATAAPVALIESNRPDGPSFFVSRRQEGAVEVRHFFRRLSGRGDAAEFPLVEPARMLEALGRLARRLHDAGIRYGDLSMGNVLARLGDDGELELILVDANRARIGKPPWLWGRVRDSCRFPIVARSHRQAFLAGYWGESPSRWSPRWWLWVASVRAYLLKHAFKNALRRRRATGGRHGGSHHPHLPPPPRGAQARDRAVWDRLSDQPHQHAGRWAKTAIRLADAPSHLLDLAVVAAAAPRIWRRYRELQRGLYRTPTPFGGIGIALRPLPGHEEQLLAAVTDLGVRRALLRLHPWQDEHEDEERLASELAGRGLELSFALPQNRDLVRDRARWRAAVAELGERFRPYGRNFQIGHAPNRSKWGVWTRTEYLELAAEAGDILRRLPDVFLLGPAVIDFELHMTAALVNRSRSGVRFDALSSLLYVDRRGAPERSQVGFDTVGKVVLAKAIAETGRSSGGGSWITEFNWPLWEGPHSPAGRTVSVDVERQADYLARYLLLVLGTGLVDRAFWWQLAARGYGLAFLADDGRLVRRPAFAALATLVRELEGADFLGPEPAPEGSRVYRFRRGGGDVLAAWAVDGASRLELPAPALEVVGRDGEVVAGAGATAVELGPSVRYVRLG